jgi:hypothetical protein
MARRKFYCHELQMSNVCDAHIDMLDTSSWDNDSSWIWEQAFFNDFGLQSADRVRGDNAAKRMSPLHGSLRRLGSMAAQINNEKVIYKH